jgi:hypothetical protein
MVLLLNGFHGEEHGDPPKVQGLMGELLEPGPLVAGPSVTAFVATYVIAEVRRRKP